MVIIGLPKEHYRTISYIIAQRNICNPVRTVFGRNLLRRIGKDKDMIIIMITILKTHTHTYR